MLSKTWKRKVFMKNWIGYDEIMLGYTDLGHKDAGFVTEIGFASDLNKKECLLSLIAKKIMCLGSLLARNAHMLYSWILRSFKWTYAWSLNLLVC